MTPPTTPPTTAARLRLWPHLALAGAGLVLLVWAAVVAPLVPVTCRGVAMSPGDVCVRAQGDRQQSYEQRAAAGAQSRPVIGVMGLAVAGFGAYLAVSAARQRRPDPVTG